MGSNGKARAVVSYIRVSTRKQGASGLGLEAQQATAAEYASREGARIVAEYREVESGKKAARPELLKALAHCRAAKATLVVAKLDRLSRNMAFLSALMDSDIDFVCLDNPHANRLTLHVMAAMAEQEARATSERTKAALAAAKRRGVLLGSRRPGHWDGLEARRTAGSRRGVRRAAELRTAAARQHNAVAVETALELRKAGLPWQAVATELNDRGLVTRRGNAWSKSSIFTAVVEAAAGCLLPTAAGLFTSAVANGVV